jgi:hypothetical protein
MGGSRGRNILEPRPSKKAIKKLTDKIHKETAANVGNMGNMGNMGCLDAGDAVRRQIGY